MLSHSGGRRRAGPSKEPRASLPLGWLLAGLCSLPAVQADDDHPPEPTPSLAGATSQRTVRLSPEQQRLAGLVSEPLAAVTQQPEIAGFGKVLDIQPLLDLRARLQAAEADAEVAAAALQLADKNHARVKSLHDADILASRELSTAEAQWQSDRARAQAAQRHVEDIHREARHLWGDALEHLALDGQAALLESLATHRRALVQITLPTGASPASRSGAVYVGREFDRNRAVRAELISAAPRTDELVQGETWFFHVPAEHLRAGMRVNAWAIGGGQRHGAALPTRAVVWHGGQSWVYRDDGAGRYTRLPVALPTAAGDLLFMDASLDAGFTPGVRIVTVGAQTLLSEEFRGHIPDEDDD